MKVKNLPLPPNRSVEQLRRHFEIEREIAARLMRATRDERREIYATMYDELFERVPDHPRLQIREDAQLWRDANVSKWQLVEEFIDDDTVFIEFAPGSCRFAVEVCKRARMVYGIDISDQTGELDHVPDNFKLVVYDGYNLDMEDGVADIVFSDQLLEHFHPEDTKLHFEIVKRLLKPGGVYVLRTPHLQSGPHDISMYFCDEPEGFHLKEWTYGEFDELLRDVGYSAWSAYRLTKGRMIHVPLSAFISTEAVLRAMPRSVRVRLAERVFNNIVLVVKK